MRPLASLAAKIWHFLWPWGFLKLILLAITLVVLLYVEEDWRGARAWAATKAKWEARGVSFDPQKYYPPPVQDDLNLAALPLFDLAPDPDPEALRELSPMKLRHALDESLRGGDLPRLGDTPEKIRTSLLAAYAKAFNGAPAPADTLSQFEALYPLVTELHTAAAKRPYCRFNQDYSSNVQNRSFSLLTTQIALSKKIALHGRIALIERRPDVALDDIKLNLRLAAGVSRDPTLVAGLVAIGITAINRSMIDEGLMEHAWSNEQLGELQKELASIDYLSAYQFTMRGEIVTGSVAMLDYIKIAHVPGKQNSLFTYWPSGWIDLTKARVVDFMLRELAGTDPNAHCVYPGLPRSLELEFQHEFALPWRFAPWNILFSTSAGPFTNAQLKFGQIQAWLDQDRIVCGLERYRLAQGKYPTDLDALVPAYIETLPQDVMGGHSYRYVLRPDGAFLLYSIGWNETDEGGKVGRKEGAIDALQGDWPWPTWPAPKL